MKNIQPLPEEIFHICAALLPRCVAIAEQTCELAPVEIYLLWYIRQFGKETKEGEVVFLRHKLTEVLEREFRYSAKNVSDLIKSMHERGLIKQGANLKREEMRLLYGTTDGRKAIVVLCADGSKKIEAFKMGCRDLFGSVVQELPQPLRGGISRLFPMLVKFAKPVLDAVGRLKTT